jgi:hypothetical protein
MKSVQLTDGLTCWIPRWHWCYHPWQIQHSNSRSVNMTSCLCNQHWHGVCPFGVAIMRANGTNRGRNLSFIFCVRMKPPQLSLPFVLAPKSQRTSDGPNGTNFVGLSTVSLESTKQWVISRTLSTRLTVPANHFARLKNNKNYQYVIQTSLPG